MAAASGAVLQTAKDTGRITSAARDDFSFVRSFTWAGRQVTSTEEMRPPAPRRSTTVRCHRYHTQPQPPPTNTAAIFAHVNTTINSTFHEDAAVLGSGFQADSSRQSEDTGPGCDLSSPTPSSPLRPFHDLQMHSWHSDPGQITFSE